MVHFRRSAQGERCGAASCATARGAASYAGAVVFAAPEHEGGECEAAGCAGRVSCPGSQGGPAHHVHLSSPELCIHVHLHGACESCDPVA